jgi:hypothetical protein
MLFKSIRFLYVLLSINSLFYVTSSVEIQGLFASDSSTPAICNLSCEECGINSERCVYNPVKCSIKCECKPGFEGDRCTDLVTTTKSNNKNEDFKLYKDQTWTAVINELETSQLNQNIVENTLLNLKKLFEEIYLANKLDINDISRLGFVLEHLNNSKLGSFYLNENLIDSILTIFDNLIATNRPSNESNHEISILSRANSEHANISIKLFQILDDLIKHFRLGKSNNSAFRLKFRNFEALIFDINGPINQNLNLNSSVLVKFESTKPKVLLDSIRLDEKILKKRYKSDKIKVAFKIFFNYDQANTNETSNYEDEFYRQLVSDQTNFFYEITRLNRSQDDRLIQSELARNFFISSNVLSAVVYDQTHMHYHSSFDDHSSDSDEEDEDDRKFVRIQFGIDLTLLRSRNNQAQRNSPVEKHLKCVFWDHSSLKWSSRGCFMSVLESKLIEDESTTSYSSLYQKVCYCNHLTSFALLFDPEATVAEETLGDELEDRFSFTHIFEFFLEMLTYVGVLTSSVCYLILIISRILCFRVDRSSLYRADDQTGKRGGFFGKLTTSSGNYRDVILRHLYLSNTVSLLATNVFFILIMVVKPGHFLETDSMIHCYLIASILHYFILMSFCFSLGIAWQHFIKLAKVFDQPAQGSCHYRSVRKNYLVVKWYLFSIFYPMSFAIYGFVSRSHNEPLVTKTCWIPAPDLYFIFVAPLSVLLIASLLIYIFVFIKVTTIYNYTFCLNLRRLVNKKAVLRQDRDLNTIDPLNASYINQRVVILLSFSFVSMGLTWLLGVFIIVSAKLHSHLLKMLFDFLFCVFNSFHGVSLLIGNWLARKYSKPGELSTSTFTKTALINTANVSENGQTSNQCEMNIMKHERPILAVNSVNVNAPKRKLSLSSRFCLAFYDLFLGCSKAEEPHNRASQMRPVHPSQKKSDKAKVKSNMLEFSIVNYESSDSNPNGHTISSHITGGGHSFSEVLPTYYIGAGVLSAAAKAEMSVNSANSGSTNKGSASSRNEEAELYQTSAV